MPRTKKEKIPAYEIVQRDDRTRQWKTWKKKKILFVKERKKIKCKNWKLNKHEKLPITWLKKKRGSVQILDLERDSRRTHARAVNCLYTTTLRKRTRTRKKPRERNKEDSFKCCYICYLLHPRLPVYLFICSDQPMFSFWCLCLYCL